MTRYLFWVAVLGVVAIPDWASACRPGWGWGQPIYTACPPAYAPVAYPSYPVCPTYVYPAPAFVCPPVTGVPLAPPRIDPIPKAAVPFPAPAPGGANASETGSPRPPAIPAAPPKIDDVRPAAGSDANPVVPRKADVPVKPDPGAKSGSPQALPNFPKVEIPESIGPLPKLDVPKEPDFRPIGGTKDEGPKVPAAPKGVAPAVPEAAPKLPPLDAAKGDGFKLPPIDLPKENGLKLPPLPGAETGGLVLPGPAAPSAAPMPAPSLSDPLIPVPAMPLPEAKKPDGLPGLTLPPPESPVAPVAPPKVDSVSRSSPLGVGREGELSVTVNLVKGAGQPTGGYRDVTFYNYTGRDLSLTIEGQTVKLPAKMFVNTKLAATFTWSHGDRPAARETVPVGSAGADVIIRE